MKRRSIPGEVFLSAQSIWLNLKDLCRSAVLPAVRRALPLWFRKALAQWVGRSRFRLLSIHLLADPAQGLAPNLHKFLWRRHLAYAEGYDASRFTAERIDESRRTLLREIDDHLRERGIMPEKDVESVFDAGCSLGYLLRFAERDVFRSATLLRGLDIDRPAIEAGTAYLRSVGSRVEISAGDIADLDSAMGDRRYDVVLCCGVLLYLDEIAAGQVVSMLLNHTRLVLGLICLAHPTIENSGLSQSAIRSSDGAHIHNLDTLVEKAGGRIVLRQWKKKEATEFSPPYSLLVEPSGAETAFSDGRQETWQDPAPSSRPVRSLNASERKVLQNFSHRESGS